MFFLKAGSKACLTMTLWSWQENDSKCKVAKCCLNVCKHVVIIFICNRQHFVIATLCSSYQAKISRKAFYFYKCQYTLFVCHFCQELVQIRDDIPCTHSIHYNMLYYYCCILCYLTVMCYLQYSLFRCHLAQQLVSGFPMKRYSLQKLHLKTVLYLLGKLASWASGRHFFSLKYTSLQTTHPSFPVASTGLSTI